MATDNVIRFRTSTNPDDVLELAKGVYDDVIVLGWDKDDCLDIRSSDGLGRKSDALYLIEMFKTNLMNGVYDE